VPWEKLGRQEEKKREGKGKMGRRCLLGRRKAGPKEKAGLEADGPAREKGKGEGWAAGLERREKGKGGFGGFFFLSQHTTNKTNPTKINATHIHLFYLI
jgi:hypothetical protein